MRVLVRILQVIVALALVTSVVLWFGARRGDRGFIEEEITIARPAPAVFRWISSEDLVRRWISNLLEVRKVEGGSLQSVPTFRVVQLVSGHRLDMSVRIVRVVPNQELGLLISSGASASEGFSTDSDFKLIAGDDYTRLVFSSHTQFVSLSDRIFEPVLTIAMQRKVHDDLAKLKILMEAESEKSASPR
jgi:hypothetical protein